MIEPSISVPIRQHDKQSSQINDLNQSQLFLTISITSSSKNNNATLSCHKKKPILNKHKHMK